MIMLGKHSPPDTFIAGLIDVSAGVDPSHSARLSVARLLLYLVPLLQASVPSP